MEARKNFIIFQYSLDIKFRFPISSVVMFNDQLAKLEKAKADIQQLEAKIAAEREAALAKLPSDFGYASLNDFIKALTAAAKSGGKAKGKPGRKVKADSAPKAPKAAKPGKGKRARITDEIKAQVKALAEAGKTGQEIAKLLSISAPSVQNIKKSFGLVKSRSTSEVAPSTPAPVAAVAPVSAEVTL